jgi:beta-galactosidase/beta-glucuronidase
LLHFVPDGIFAAAKVLAPISNGQTAQAIIGARATVTNDGISASPEFQVRFDVFDTTGKKVASAQTPTAQGSTLAPGTSTTVTAPVSLAPANVWSTARPYLYTVKATLVAAGADGDSVNETVGFHSTKWTADNGFYLNEEHFKIKGFCDHNDFGA